MEKSMNFPIIISIILLILSRPSFSNDNERYYQLVIELPESLSNVINIDGLQKSSGMQMSFGRLSMDQKEFPVRFAGSFKTNTKTKYVFDMPLEIEGASTGKAAAVVLPLHPQYVGIPCTSIINEPDSSQLSILFIASSKLQIQHIELMKEFENNVCLAKSDIDSNSCVIDRPGKYKQNNSYKVPSDTNCGYGGLKPTLITVQGTISIAK